MLTDKQTDRQTWSSQYSALYRLWSNKLEAVKQQQRYEANVKKDSQPQQQQRRQQDDKTCDEAERI